MRYSKKCMAHQVLLLYSEFIDSSRLTTQYSDRISQWYGTLVPDEEHSFRKASIEFGAQLLFDLIARVAGLLGNALYELIADNE